MLGQSLRRVLTEASREVCGGAGQDPRRPGPGGARPGHPRAGPSGPEHANRLKEEAEVLAQLKRTLVAAQAEASRKYLAPITRRVEPYGGADS